MAAAEFLDNSSLTSFASGLVEEGRSDTNRLMTEETMLRRAQRRIRQKHAIPAYLEKDESFIVNWNCSLFRLNRGKCNSKE